MQVNTRSKDSAGSLDDFRSTERHRVGFLDKFADELLLNFKLTFSGFKVRDDILNPDGTVNTNAVYALGPKILTPSRFRSWYNQRRTDFETREMLQQTAETEDQVLIRIDPQNSSRIQVADNLRTADILHQFSARLNEVSPG